jgi:tripartite motif-containing protein 71
MINPNNKKEGLKIKYQNANMFRIVPIFLIILLLGLMSASFAHAETENYSFIRQIGSSGSSDGQFISPRDVAVDSSGNVFVADTGNHRIQKFDKNGKLLANWGSEGRGDGQFIFPYSISLDSSGNVYVGDANNLRIQKFDNKGHFITKWGTNGTPYYIEVNSSGCVYVDISSYVEIYDSNGKFLGHFEDNRYCTYMAFDSSNNIYSSFWPDAKVVKLDSNGKLIAKWNSYGTGNFICPLGIAVDSSNNVYVVDGDNYIKKLSSSCKFITKWGSGGSGEGQLSLPQGIAVDSLGNVYVSDVGDNCIKIYAPVKSALPVANFTSNLTSGYSPLNVQFTDKSSGTPTSWKWNFGDGNTSTVKNPIHKYSKVGNYTVSLKVSNAVGSNTTTKTNYIKVKPLIPKPVAAFTASPRSGTKPLKVQFTDKSTGSPTSWKWNFGDGTTSTTHNPLHTYIKKGKLTVTLTATNAAGSSTKTMTSYITVK